MKPTVRAALAALIASLALGFVNLTNISVGSVGPGTIVDPDNPTAVPTALGTATAGPGELPPGQIPPPKEGLSCKPGRNGGRTDIGVSANKIRLAATVVLDGPAASLLSASPIGMRAVVDKVNASGGICGRGIELIMRNDGFDQRRGQDYIRTWATDPSEDIFALAVVPSAEGLGAAIKSGVISSARIPVVGTDGMRQEQYTEPWVWPVATATVSTMRIMATYGYREKKARTFAIVWDDRYQFGKEGRAAFIEQVEKLGGTIVADRPLNPTQPAYSSEVANFNEKCGEGKCDMVAMLLLPDTAQKWMTRKPVMGRLYTAGAQTLFTDNFGRACAGAAGARCHGLAIWTGYNPPIDRYAGIPDVAAYVDDIKTIDPNADIRNQFMEGAYLGMSLMVEALQRVGPDLTRERLRAVLDSMDYLNGITAGLQWRPGRHNANVSARSFSVVMSGSSFLGWRDERTGWVRDPAFGGR